MKTTLHTISGPWSGHLCIVPRPRGGDWLADEVRAMHRAGIEQVVSMLTADETTELELENENRACEEAGIHFLNLPVADRGVPASRMNARRTMERILANLEAGRSVAVHCRQGIGRSSLMAAGVLVLAGVPPAEAFARITTARGRPVPDTAEQQRWVESFRASLESARHLAVA